MKKKLLFIGKSLLLALALQGLFLLWAMIVFSHMHLFSESTASENMLDFGSMLLFASLFIALTVFVSRLGVETKADRKNMTFLRRLATPAKQMLGVLAVILLIMSASPLKAAATYVKAHRCYNTATDVIAYPTDSDRTDFFGTPAEHPVILVNEPAKKVSFLCGNYGALLVMLDLKPETAENQPDGQFVLYTAPLSGGGTVTVYYSFDPVSDRYDETLCNTSQYASGVELTASDGSKWYAPITSNDDLSFAGTPEAQVNGAEALSDTVITVQQTTPLKEAVKGYDRPTLFINTHDAENVYVYTLFEERFNDGNTNIRIEDATLIPVTDFSDARLNDWYVVSEIRIPEQDTVLYACRRRDTAVPEKTEAFAAVKADGTLYLSKGSDFVQTGLESSEYAVGQMFPLRDLFK